MKTRTMVLELDEEDFATIQGEIAKRQAASRQIAPNESTIIPDGDSNLAGSLVAEMVRDLDEYRALYESQRSD